MEATLFVHPGFLQRIDMPLTINRSEIASYGDYSAYLKNLRALYSVSVQRVFLVELEGKQLNGYHRGFKPDDRDVLIEWSGFNFYPLERTVEGFDKCQGLAQDELPCFLRGQGIDSVILAGEMGPYSGSHQGCVGRIYLLLKDYMLVRAAKGCIFPLVPCTDFVNSASWKDDKLIFWDGKQIFDDLECLMRCLYEDTV